MTVTSTRISFVNATRRLALEIKRLPDPLSAPAPPRGPAHRIEIDIEPTDFLPWLAAQSRTDRSYWRDRSDSFELAGLGCAALFSSHEPLDRDEIETQIPRLTDLPNGIRYLGGLRFDPTLPAEKRDRRWEAFGSCRFVLHRFELVREKDRHILACNVLANESTPRALDNIAERALRLSQDSEWQSPLSTPGSREDCPDRVRWNDNIHRVLASVKAGECEKLVLARRTGLNLAAALDPWQLLSRLRAGTLNCFLFGIQPENGDAFVGVSPERLYRRDHARIQTEAVAGTRPRGHDAEADARLADELIASRKEQREHQLVISGLQAGLERICVDCTVNQPAATMKLARLQHLASQLSGHLRPGVSDAEILSALHPTPAVGGYPAPEAPRRLRDLEPFDRGWYAGPVGWLGADSAEFAVGIRSALVSAKRLDLFSGAGIVENSDPQAEWDELESKIDPFLDLAPGDHQ